MLKIRTNLRKVATIIACLAVTTIFATCNKTNGDDDNGGSGKIDKKLVGLWTRSTGGVNPSTYYWLFNNDGTFHYYLMDIAEYSYKGKYSVANDRIDFTNVVFTNASNTPPSRDEPNSWVFYEIVHDDWGDQLRISNNEGSFTGASWWRRTTKN